MSNSLKSVNYRNPSTPQSQKAKAGQVKNNAGGYTFKLGALDIAKRFLILGSDTNFYQTGKTLSKMNAEVLIAIIEKEGLSKELVDEIVAVSQAGRAPKQDPGLFALAVASSFGTTEEKQYALSKLPQVARTASTLFTFVGYALQFRSWGRALKNAVAAWYTNKPTDRLAYQIVKYGQREGWTHRDIFRVTHPKGSESFDGLAKYVNNGVTDNVPAIVTGYEKAKTASAKEIPALVEEFGLTWEMVPSDKRDADFWRTVLRSGNLPLGALVRQLPTLTRLGVLAGTNEDVKRVVGLLGDKEYIRKARLHPLAILLAMKTYQSGRSLRGESTWRPVSSIVSALDKAFYLSFETVEATNKNFLLGLDVSGSMGSPAAGLPLSSRELEAAMALVLKKTEPWVHTIGFTGGSDGYRWGSRRAATPAGSTKYARSVTELNIAPDQRLTDAVQEVSNLPFGSTDCALPMLYALERKMDVDVFVIITDNETWAGQVHPHEALTQYRRQMNKPEAKLIVLATQATPFTIADPSDPGMLDIAGFDSAVPSLINQFITG